MRISFQQIQPIAKPIRCCFLISLSNSLFILLCLCNYLLFNVYASETDDHSLNSRPFSAEETCASATPSSLGWKYHLFGNASEEQALDEISEWQLPANLELLSAASNSSPASCVFGICDQTKSKCRCSTNYVGSRCENCAGRTLWSQLNGVIASNAPSNYATNSRCTWIISPPSTQPQLHLGIKLFNFSSECSWDLLFIFDGTTAVSSNLLAVISGEYSLDKRNQYRTLYPESGSALIYFYSDGYLNYGGFTLDYTYSYCPRDCSGHGHCVGGPSTQAVTTTLSVSASTNGTTATESTTTSMPHVPIPQISQLAACLCDPGYTGKSCEKLSCLNDCSSENGTCQTDGTCKCNDGFAGVDCSIDISNKSDFFSLLPVKNERIDSDMSKAPGASGSAVLIGNVVWLFGGFDFDLANRQSGLAVRKFDLATSTFISNVTVKDISISNRYGLTAHSSECNPELVYLFGGTLTESNGIANHLVEFNVTSRAFRILSGFPTLDQNTEEPALSGHTAHLICDPTTGVEKLYVFFGYSPEYGLSDWLRIWDFNLSSWHEEQSPYSGRAWHSSVFDPASESVFIYGGFSISQRRQDVEITGDIIRYDLDTTIWTYIGRLPQQRAFHTATLLPYNHRHVLIYGGTMRVTSLKSDQCFVARPFVLDLDSGCVSFLTEVGFNQSQSRDLPLSFWRIGHSAVVHNKTVKIFGGFDGTVIDSDVIEYKASPCESRFSLSECLTINGYTCRWACEQCYPIAGDPKPLPPCLNITVAPLACADKLNMSSSNDTIRNCAEKRSCKSCTKFRPTTPDEVTSAESVSCRWYADEACIRVSVAKDQSQKPTTSTQKSILDSPNTMQYASQSAATNPRFRSLVSTPDECSLSCDSLKSCTSCTGASGCLWCNTLALCLPTHAYRIAFPYGQCQDWTLEAHSCRTDCSTYQTCAECEQDLRCGWCNNEANTGLGVCMRGGLNSATNSSSTNSTNQCPPERWYFASCPLCQCSGHSTCENGTAVCLACQHNTGGDHCERCAEGYFGNALNGGNCKPCQCNNHGTICDTKYGKCKCNTQGVIGDHCDQCDKMYDGDALLGTCYYPIQTGYRYTMDLTKKEMKHINKINFQTKEKLGRNEVNFQLNCSRLASYVLSYTTGREVNSTEVIYQSGLCGPEYPQVEISISTTSGVPFSEPFFRFRIGISNFTHPFLITLVATEEQQLIIYLLLIAVFGCFLVVLVVAIIVFQIKRRYDEYHRRQQVKTELRRMAKRPFAMVNFQLVPQLPPASSMDPSGEGGSYASGQPRQHVKAVPQMPRASPMPVTLQPMAVPGAAVMTVLIQLPLVAANPRQNDRSNQNGESNSSSDHLGAPSALATGSVIVRAGKAEIMYR